MSKSETTDRHANARDRKRTNSRKMVVTNRGIFTLEAMKGKRAAETRPPVHGHRSGMYPVSGSAPSGYPRQGRLMRDRILVWLLARLNRLVWP